MFHVSLLKKYIPSTNHVIDWNVIQVDPKVNFPVQPASISGSKAKFPWNQEIRKVKVQWTHYSPEDATWEMDMREVYPHLF